MKNLLWVIGILIAAIVGFVGGRSYRTVPPRASPISDTIVRTDTIRDTVPVPVDSIIVRWKVLKVPVTDTIYTSSQDSVTLALPIQQKEYQDSTYHAWVSGYEPSLDSIHVYSRQTFVTQVQYVERKKHWGLGVQLGAGLCGNKLQPYIGIGITYSLLDF